MNKQTIQLKTHDSSDANSVDAKYYYQTERLKDNDMTNNLYVYVLK